MKISVLLLFAVIFSVSAKSYAQEARVTFDLKNVSVNDVFNTIRSQTSYSFWYDLEDVDASRIVSVKAKNQEVKEVLNILFKNKDVNVQMVDNHIVIKSSNSSYAPPIAQQKKHKVTGVVSDAMGTVIGANIIEKGTTNGVVTDMDGKYTLEVSENAILQVSYIGYIEQNIDVNDRDVINILIKEDTQALDEVVVVGYGVQKKESLTGAISTIKKTDITQNVTSNLSNVLAGRLSGVFARNTSGAPGSGSKISIRGSSTYNNTEPLTIVDGIERDYSNLDPNEIASISVLKDAASAAVYGARAANGVILVTTKRGQEGKPRLNYSGSVGFQKPTGYPEMMSPYEFATMKNKAAVNMGYDIKNPSHQGQFVSNDQMEQYRTGAKGVDWWDLCMNEVVPQTQHNLNIDGGNSKIKYYFSLGYLNQAGMFDNISFERYNFRSNVDTEIMEGLTAQVTIDGRVQYNNSPGDNANSIFTYLTADPLSFGFTPDNKPIDTGAGNPHQMIHHSGYDNKRSSFFQGSLTLNYEIPFLKGLSARGLVSYEKNYDFNKRFSTPYTLYYVDDKNEIISSKLVGSQTSLKETFDDKMEYNLNLSLNYNNTFGKHSFSGLFLYEQAEGFGDDFWASRVNYVSNNLDQLFAGGDSGKDNYGSGYETGRQSFVGRISYNYDSKYYIESSLRYDGSVIFAPGNRWGTFPSLSAAWRISEESFMESSSSVIDNLKLRASYGVLGNDRVDAYQYINYYQIATGAIFGGEISQGLSQAPLANESITWEKAKSLDIGIESRFWGGLLSMEVDYFYKRTSDILAKKTTSTPDTFGSLLPDVNYAIVDNKGFDLMLRHDNKIKNVNYFVSSTVSFARNKVIRIDDPANQKDYLLRVGQPMNFVTGYKSNGLFQSDEEAANYIPQFGGTPSAGDIKYIDINEDGKIDEDDQTKISDYNGTPELFFGLNMGVSWKGFEVNAQLQGAANSIFIYDGRAKTLLWMGANNTYSYLMDTWSPENTDAQYPRAWKDSNPNNAKYSDFWLRNAAYIKLKTLELAYNLPVDMLKKAKIDKVRIFLTATDLFTLKGDTEFDPEASEMNYYPQQKTFNIGLNVSF